MPVSSDMVISALKYIGPALFILGVAFLVIAPLQTTSMNLNTGLSDVCSSSEGIAVLNDLIYDEKTSLVQVMLPTNLDTRFTYPRNTFNILSAVVDDVEGNLGEAVNLYAGLYDSRDNYRLLETCDESACFCVVKNDMEFFTYRYINSTACFPRLYAYAREEFDNNINTQEYEGDDYSVFKQAIIATLSELNSDNSEEAVGIIECYTYLDIYGTSSMRFFYGSSQSENNYLTLDIKGGTILGEPSSYLEGQIIEFYELTKAGMFSQISACYNIPKKNSCFCPSVKGNLLGSQTSQPGILLGIAGSFNNPRSLDISALVISTDTNPNNCVLYTEEVPE